MKNIKKNNKKQNNRKTQKNKQECVYIFGYGSLMSEKSRFKTHKQESKAYPVVVNKHFGYKRCWNTLIPNNKIVLGLEKNNKKNTPINGILFKVCKCCYKQFLEREKRYEEKKVDKSCIRFLKNKPKDFNTLKVVTFVTKDKHNLNKMEPDPKRYIPSYYVNLVLEGISSFDKNFQNSFLKHTYC